MVLAPLDDGGSANEGTVRILVDSGAALNACPLWHAADNAVRPAPDVNARIATGDRAEHHGQKSVVYRLSDGNKARVEYQVLSVNKPVLPVSELVRRGHTCVFSPAKSFITRSGRSWWRPCPSKRSTLV